MRPTHPRHSITILLSFLFAGLFPNTAAAQVVSGTWSNTGSMSAVRTGAAASLLQDGRVLITGGTDASGPLSSAEVYSSGSFSPAGAMLLARSNHASATLQDGRVLVLGGSTASGPTNETEIYNPSTNAWTVGNPMAASRSGHTATLLKDGRVLIAGGSGSGAPGTTLEIFNPATGTFSLASSLSASRSNHAAALLADGRVLITGGYNSSGALNSSEIYDPSTGALSVGPSMSTPRAFHTATTLLNGDVLIAGGNNGSSDLSSAEIYSGAGFSATGSLGSARSGHRAFLLPNNNSVLIVGGSALTAELYRSWSSSFVTTGSPSAPRTGGAGEPLASDGLLLMAGGGNSSAELYPFATVKTDKDDYAPGEHVIITGAGWQPGETVTLTLLEVPFLDTHGPYAAVADGSGRIFNNQFVPDEDDLSIRFYLTATGSASAAQAQTTFRDSRTITSATLNGGTSVTVAAGASITAVVNVTTDNGGGNSNWRSTGWLISTIAPGTVTCVDHANHDGIGSYSETFTITAPTTPGTYNAYFINTQTTPAPTRLALHLR